jgi:chromosome segregation ATPase
MLDEHRKTLEVEMAKLPEIQAAADKSNQAREDWAVATRTLEGIRDLTDKFVNKGKLRYELDRIDKEILGLEAKDGATASIRISKQDELKELERQRSVYDTQLGQFRARKDAREELATVQNYVRETFEERRAAGNSCRGVRKCSDQPFGARHEGSGNQSCACLSCRQFVDGSSGRHEAGP